MAIELTDLQRILDKYNSENGTHLMIDVEYSGNDGCFKYWVGTWDYDKQHIVPPFSMCDNFKDFKEMIIRHYGNGVE